MSIFATNLIKFRKKLNLSQEKCLKQLESVKAPIKNGKKDVLQK